MYLIRVGVNVRECSEYFDAILWVLRFCRCSWYNILSSASFQAIVSIYAFFFWSLFCIIGWELDSFKRIGCFDRFYYSPFDASTRYAGPRSDWQSMQEAWEYPQSHNQVNDSVKRSVKCSKLRNYKTVAQACGPLRGPFLEVFNHII